jgi:hypothetical protein
VTRCTFPYGAVYVVADRSTGRGIVLDQNMPDSVKRSRFGKGNEDAQKPVLRTVGGDTEEAPKPRAEPRAEPVPAPAADPAAEPTDESQVKKRRAAFKVIDGGG